MPRELRGLRLLLVGNWPPPPGGVAVHLGALAEAARRAGARVTVLDIGRGQNRTLDVIPSGREARFAGTLVALAGRSEIVHLHTSGANPKSWVVTAAVGLAARATRSSAVATFHSGHGPRWLTTPARALAARAALSTYTRVVCVTEEISRALARIGAAEGRHLVAPAFGREGLEPGALPPAVERLRAAHPHLFSAMLAPGRDYGARELFDAFALLRRNVRDVGLVVFGPGTDNAETSALADEYGIKPIVRLGAIERPAALAIMRASDIFIRPTLVDGDAVSVREALALGTTVVATRVGHRPSEVRLCAPGSAPDLARALENALAGAADLTTRASAESDADGIETVLDLYARLQRSHLAA